MAWPWFGPLRFFPVRFDSQLLEFMLSFVMERFVVALWGIVLLWLIYIFKLWLKLWLSKILRLKPTEDLSVVLGFQVAGLCF